MIAKNYVVPTGMLKAAVWAMENSSTRFCSNEQWVNGVLEAAICWWAENGSVPTVNEFREIVNEVISEQSDQVKKSIPVGVDFLYSLGVFRKWQERMFLEEDVRGAVSSLFWGDRERNFGVPDETVSGYLPIRSHNEQVLEAYRRGKEAKSAK